MRDFLGPTSTSFVKEADTRGFVVGLSIIEAEVDCSSKVLQWQGSGDGRDLPCALQGSGCCWAILVGTLLQHPVGIGASTAGMAT